MYKMLTLLALFSSLSLSLSLFFLPLCQASEIKCFHKYSRLKNRNVSVLHLQSDKYQPCFTWTYQCVELLNILLIVSGASVIYNLYKQI